jgi:hypothetical protein
VVVLTPPLFDQDLCLLERVEELAVQEFVAQLAVEGFDGAVLPTAARFDEQGGDELGAVVEYLRMNQGGVAHAVRGLLSVGWQPPRR